MKPKILFIILAITAKAGVYHHISAQNNKTLQVKKETLELFGAVQSQSGNTELAELLINRGADVNAKYNNDDGMTPLHYTSMHGNKKMAELLITKGANVNSKSNDGRTPLHYALHALDIVVPMLLIAKGADVNAKDKYFSSPLHYVLSNKLLQGYSDDFFIAARKLIGLLIENGADVNVKNSYGITPIHYASLHRELKQIALLFILKNADLNVKDKDGWDPLYYAVKSYNNDIAELLKTKQSDGYGKYIDETFLLHDASSNGYKKTVEFLIAKGADVNAKDDRGFKGNNSTPLHCVVKNKYTEVIEDGHFKAAELPGYKEVVELLIAKGADVNAKDDHGSTPLHYAAQNEYTQLRVIYPLPKYKEVVELLIAKGADVNAKDDHGSTPLNYASNASGRSNKEIIELLISKGAVK